jgi:hypothetical protein
MFQVQFSLSLPSFDDLLFKRGKEICRETFWA